MNSTFKNLFSFILLLAIIVCSKPVNSQNEYKLSQLLSGGIGYGNAWMITGLDYSYYSSNSSYEETRRTSPSLSLYYEYILKKKLGIGYLGVGAKFSYQTAVWEYQYLISSTNYYSKTRWNFYDLALRGLYHFIIPNQSKIEPYAGFSHSFVLWTQNSEDLNGYYSNSRSIFPIFIGYVGGARYRFTKFTSVFAEIGWPFSFISCGVNLQI